MQLNNKDMRKLIKCSDYVIEQSMPYSTETAESEGILVENFYNNVPRYANFLKQNLSERYQINGVLAHPLNRFIPCDLDGNVLSEPKVELSYLSFHNKRLKQYQEAKDRMIFEECVYDEEMEVVRYAVGKDLFYTGSCNYENKYITIEDLTNLDLTLTENAIKQLEI